MMRIDFRSTTAADEHAIVDLIKEANGMAPGHPMLEHRHLRWKYWEPYDHWPGSRSYVLTRNDRIVAHGAVVPAVCAWTGGRVNLLHVIDWAARPDAPGAGGALMHRLAGLSDAIVTSGGTAAALRLLPQLGFAQSSTIVTRYARPIRPLRYLELRDLLRLRALGRCMRNLLWALSARSHPPASWRARALDEEQVTAAQLPRPAPRQDLAVLERSVAALRHWLRCPAVPTELYAVESGTDVRGYFVLAYAPGQARLADCWLECAQECAWDALVQLAVQRAARHREVAEMVAFCSDPLLAGALERCGFHARYGRALSVRAAAGARIPDVSIRIQMLDDDAGYLHDGSRFFWA
jgi:Acetyltransferase (GNAT) domain